MVVFDFTGRYRTQKWIGERADVTRVDCTDLIACSGYCADETAEILQKKVSGFPLSETFYLDSGNYHYISYFRAMLIDEEFDILLIDNHTDAQEPLFPLLSCGSWVLKCLRECGNLGKVYMTGQGEAFASGRVVRVGAEDIIANGLPRENHERALFVSIDLDVLSSEYFTAVWDQGEMTPGTLAAIMLSVRDREKICGVDICG